ncbi:MAG: methyltransferase domain-containing protein [Acidimicrobiia bacterium]
MSDAWDPATYDRFKAERTQPFLDLIDLVEPARLLQAVDLGCGTGELTLLAADRLRPEAMLGIDNSPAMLADAAPRARAGVAFELGDLAGWTSAPVVDLVLANAALQWVPDHAEVLARWTAALAPGGQLAVQVPTNADHPSHRLAAEVAADERFACDFPDGPPADPVAANVLRPERYADTLHDLGFDRQHVRLQVYGHVLPSTASVVDWMTGTSLTRFRRVLPPGRYDAFVTEYRTRLLADLGDRSPYFYAFKRILMWGRLPS